MYTELPGRTGHQTSASKEKQTLGKGDAEVKPMCERGPSAAATREEMEEASLVRASPTPSSTSSKFLFL
ncbi:hypothetical protein HYQ44_014803 [Verticillium longisporum]|nr:hypothetical protein HYQ44_014803 [Verticillium longisporum]